ACPSEHQLFSSLSFCPSLGETSKTIYDSNPENCTDYISAKELEASIDNQSEPEEIFPQQVCDAGLQDPPENKTQTLTSSAAEQTMQEKCSASLMSHDNQATSQDPSASCDSAVSPVIGPPQQRVAHKCAQCGKCYIYRYKLLEHQRIHTGENPYKCSQCGKAFRRTSDMSTHRRTQCTKAGYVCLKCGNCFESVQDKFRHKCVHSVQKFECPHCGKSFSKMYLLGRHQLTHTKNRTLRCRQCGESYPSMSELRSHQKTHLPKQSNQCVQCGKFFSSITCLAAHELRHRQKKTQLCEKTYTCMNHLKRHIKTHSAVKA
ncbi:hypothetical protein LDENG_00106550, partial [Lucifuga dentata]